jgi:eukaryotic-like serine/threonine-protein kinase
MSARATCSECGKVIPAESPGGFCAECLLRLGLGEVQGAGGRGQIEEGQDRGHETSPVVNASLTEKSGDRIGRYRLLQEIGHGGYGVVYMAEQEEPVRRRVALKVIKLGMDTRQVVARFEAERQALALMDHPNIARVLDAGATDAGRPYFVMELVGGIKITDYCEQNQLDTRQRLDLFIQVCRAIQHAHQKGVIHRDIKPSNVLVATHDGVAVPKVIDFGIAKATQGRLTDQTVFTAFEQFLGTPAYMSPEQAEFGGLDVDTRSDIYSLGVLLYELLTGKTPFDGKELLAAGLDRMRRTIREQEPVRPSTRLSTMAAGDLQIAAKHRQTDAPRLIHLVRGDLDWIVMKCLEKDRARRYETANGLARDLERHLSNELVVARPPSRIDSLQKLYRRNRLLFTTSGLLLVVGMLGAVGVFWEWRQAKQHAEREHTERRRAEQATQRALATLTQMEAIEVRRAEEYYEAGDRRNMLPYLALVLRQNPTNRIAAERLMSTLSHRNWARLACPPLMHSNRVTSAMFSRDGRYVVTSAADNTAWVWDANTGKHVSGPFTHSAEINTAEFSPDGQLVVTASDDKTARVWDARTGRPVTDPIPHPARVELARFSPGSRTFVTLCDDRAARLWDARTGRSLLEPLHHGAGAPQWRFLKETDFSPDGALFATAGNDAVVRIWNSQTGEVVRELECGKSGATCVRFSPDGERLATVGYTNTALLWNLAPNPPQAVSLSPQGNIWNVEFSPEGRRVVTASSDGTAQVWDAESGKQIGPPLRHGDQVRSAVFSPEGLRVVTAASDQAVRVWDAETGKPLTEPMEAEEPAYYAGFHPDGHRVVSVANGHTVTIWDVSPAPPFTLHFGTSIPWSGAFSPDGKGLVVGTELPNTHIRDALTGDVLTGFDNESLCAMCGVNAVEFTLDGQLVAVASDGGYVAVFERRSGKRLTPPRPFHVHHVVSARFSHDGRKLVTASWDKTARVWEPRTGEPLTGPMCHGTKLKWAEFSPDDQFILTTSGDSAARIWDARNARFVRELRHEGELQSAHFSPDGTRVLTASSDMTARIWDIRTGNLLGTLPHSMSVVSALYSPDGQRIVTTSGGSYGQLRLWDAQTFMPLTEPFGSELSVEFSSDGQRLIGGFARGGSVAVRDAWTGQRWSEPLQVGGANRFSCFSPDNRLILTATDHSATIWEAPLVPLPVTEWLPELAEALAGQRFNQRGVLEPVRPAELWAVQQKMAAWADGEDTPRTSAGRPMAASSESHTMEPPGRAPTRAREGRAVSDSFYARWAKWFLADAFTRTVLPSSPLTLAQYAQSLADQRATPAAARQALLLQPTNAIATSAVALTTTDTLQADWLSRRAMELAPGLTQKVIFDLTSARDLEGWTLTGNAFSLASVGQLVPRPTLNSLALSGETASGSALSPPFNVGSEFEYLEVVFQGGWNQGAEGEEDLVLRLLDAESGAVLDQLLPPGTHVLTRRLVKTANFKGKFIRLLLIDNNTGSSFAWIGLRQVSLTGRIQPPQSD